MELKVQLKLSPKQTVEMVFNGQTVVDVILEATPILAFDGVCGYCKGEEFTLMTRLTGEQKEYKYTEFTCTSCKAKRQLGEYKGNKGFYLKSWEEGYKKDQ